MEVNSKPHNAIEEEDPIRTHLWFGTATVRKACVSVRPWYRVKALHQAHAYAHNTIDDGLVLVSQTCNVTYGCVSI